MATGPCAASTAGALVNQLAAALATGNRVVVVAPSKDLIPEGLPPDGNPASEEQPVIFIESEKSCGRNQIVLNEWAITTGGHARTGLEDNIRMDRDNLAPSNAALVRRVVELCEKYERPVATWQQARQRLGLKQ